MSLIVTAILGALANLSDVAVKDAYEALKAIISRKFGKGAEVTVAVEKLERNPDSVGRKETLKEELARAGVDRDEELKKAAQALLEKLHAAPGGREFVQQIVTGDKNIFSGSGDVHVTYGPGKK